MSNFEVHNKDELGYTQKSEKYWFSAANDEKPVFYAKTGIASKEGFEGTTIGKVIVKAAEENADKLALAVEENVGNLEALTRENGKFVYAEAQKIEDWKGWTYGQLLDDVRALAKGMINLGLKTA